MARIVNEIPITRDDSVDNPKKQYQQEVRNDERSQLEALGLMTNKDIPKITDTFSHLAPQLFSLGVIATTSARVSSAGATSGVTTTISAVRGIITNVDFKHGITMSATSTAVFIGCRFMKVVTMAVGAKASFVGCSFEETGYVNNAGAAADVGIVGCVKTSVTAHVGVTPIFEI